MSVINDTEGKTSSRRVMGIIYLSVGLIMSVLDMFTNRDASFDVLLIVIGTGASLLGLGLFEYFAKLKNNK